MHADISLTIWNYYALPIFQILRMAYDASIGRDCALLVDTAEFPATLYSLLQ